MAGNTKTRNLIYHWLPDHLDRTNAVEKLPNNAARELQRVDISHLPGRARRGKGQALLAISSSTGAGITVLSNYMAYTRAGRAVLLISTDNATSVTSQMDLGPGVAPVAGDALKPYWGDAFDDENGLPVQGGGGGGYNPGEPGG